MNYTKPEVNHLGDAASVIRDLVTKPFGNIFDPSNPAWPVMPAYDLDE